MVLREPNERSRRLLLIGLGVVDVDDLGGWLAEEGSLIGSIVEEDNLVGRDIFDFLAYTGAMRLKMLRSFTTASSSLISSLSMMTP